MKKIGDVRTEDIFFVYLYDLSTKLPSLLLSLHTSDKWPGSRPPASPFGQVHYFSWYGRGRITAISILRPCDLWICLYLFDSAVDQVPDDVVPFAGVDAADLAQKLSPSDLAGFLDKVSDHVELGLVLGAGHQTGNALHHGLRRLNSPRGPPGQVSRRHPGVRPSRLTAWRLARRTEYSNTRPNSGAVQDAVHRNEDLLLQVLGAFHVLARPRQPADKARNVASG